MIEKEKCLWCNGTGQHTEITKYHIAYTSDDCPKCKGKRLIEHEKNNHEIYQRVCPVCGNSKLRLISEWGKNSMYVNCKLCNNTGLIDWIDEIKNANIPYKT